MDKRKPIKKIIIINTYGRSGGPIVLSLLCYLLSKRGFDAQLLILPTLFGFKGRNRYSIWRDWYRYHIHNWVKKSINRVLSVFHVNFRMMTWGFSYGVGNKCKQCFNPFFSRKTTLVIYPEVVHGNFIGANNVVRWLLYYYQFKDDTTAYGKKDVFICFRTVFNDWNLNPLGIETPLCYLEKDYFYQYNYGERKDHCFLLRKGRSRNDLPKSFDAPVIDSGTTDIEINRLFNEYKYCFFYDTQTFYSTLAIICGCVPIVIPEQGKGRNDYLKGNDGIGLGIAYGKNLEEIEFALHTREKAIEKLNEIDSRNEKSIDDFIAILERIYILIHKR